MPTKKLTVGETVEAFLSYQMVGKSPRTVGTYRTHLKQGLKTLWTINIDRVTPDSLWRYFSKLSAELTHYRGIDGAAGPVSAETMRSRHRHISAFFNWCIAEKYLVENPMKRVPMPKSPDREPKAIAIEDIERLLLATDDSPLGIRNRAIIALLCDSGCRAGGICTLTPDRLFLDEHKAIVHEKGDRLRAVPFLSYTADLLAQWMRVRPANATTVFCSMGYSRIGQPLTTSGLSQMLIDLATKAGVTGRVNPHSFRHNFGKEYLGASGNLAATAQIMGHRDTNITATVYARMRIEEITAVHQLFSPLARVLKDMQEREL